jgi:co-chaperonin GroES (HSP10)
VNHTIEPTEHFAVQAVASTSTEARPPAYGDRGWRAAKGPHPDNKSGFYATGHRVLLLGDQIEEVTAGGIVLPRKTAEAEQNLSVWATVVEIGHDAWADKTNDYCQVGDKVLVGKYTGMFCESPLDKKTYRFINDLDIITPLKKAE